MTASRRQILASAATAAASALAVGAGSAQAQTAAGGPGRSGRPAGPDAAPPTQRARRLRPGDTIGLVSPANATSNPQSMPKERRVTNRSAASPNSSVPR